VWICPTGLWSFLPVHAAGIFSAKGATINGCNFSDFCLTTYIPTLDALLRSRTSTRDLKETLGLTKWLAASAPDSPSYPALPSAREDLERIYSVINAPGNSESVASIYLQLEPSASATVVRESLVDASILHLACHAVQNDKDPLQSGFVLQDRTLHISELMSLELPRARLAFLSACETAQGDRQQPDQAIHLAASMLYAGFKSVIATMWSMGDVDGPVVAETVYTELLKSAKNGVIDLEVVPYALDLAVRKLRTSGLPPSRWATYIHMGA
jgi:CHAT domain-containing protein